MYSVAKIFEGEKKKLVLPVLLSLKGTSPVVVMCSPIYIMA